MRALWLEDRVLGARPDVPRPEPPPGEALVRVTLAGVCNTDLELVKGYYPFNGVPGHEFVGEVISSSAVEWVGRRVVGEINASCGACVTCHAGRRTHCPARTLELAGHRPTVVGRHARKLALLKHLGIATGTAADLPLREADVVVECTGNPDGLSLARAAVRPRGTIVLKSTYHGDVRMNLSAVVVDEVTLVGSRCGPFAPALALLAGGTLQVTDMVDQRFTLDEGVAAFAAAAGPGVLKVLIRP